jgi:hypothetical protein
MSLNNIYSSNNFSNVENFERGRMTENYSNARNATKTNLIPEHFNQNILNNSSSITPSDTFTLEQFNIQKPKKQFKSQLTGTTIENFGHSNMQPFFKGSKTQSVEKFNSSHILEKYQGSNIHYQKKKEIKSMFDTKNNFSHVDGSPSVTLNEKYTNRFIPSKEKSMELPFSQQMVGPGIGDGYTSNPTGGYNQANQREYVIPKRVDELRAANKPKLTYEGRVVSGLKSDSRGLVSKMAKNKVNTFYKNNPERYLKTGSSHIRAAKMRNKFYMKPVNKNHTLHYGGVGTHISKPEKKQAVKKSTKNNYMNDTIRNAQMKQNWSVNEDNQQVSDYGRGAIENKPNERDITSERRVINNLTTEVTKIMAPLLDIFKKTKKENFVGNIRPEGNMNAVMPEKQTIYDCDDVARTTIKETNIHNDRTGNIGVESKKNQSFNYDDVARTTIKETNIHNSEPNNMTPQKPKSIQTYDPEDIPETTLKETLIHDEHNGYIQNPNHNKTGAYMTNKYNAKQTNKQFTSDYEYSGVANGDVGKGGGRGYLVNKYNAKQTNKQFTSNYEYTGNARRETMTHMSYEDKKNARLNPTKEKVLRLRRPAKQGPKLNAGEDLINTQTKKINADMINIREPAEQRVYQLSPTKNNCGLTNIKDKLGEDVQRNRIQPDILDAFNKNPYTKSLSSAY